MDYKFCFIVVFGLMTKFEHSGSSLNDCTVHPETPVILRGKETYFKFDFNETQLIANDTEGTLSCPHPQTNGSWWPGTKDNLMASCPWVWETKDLWSDYGLEIYPRYVKKARCLCTECVNEQAMRCIELRRPFTFYNKTGCQGNKPTFIDAPLSISVGCVCVT